MKKFFAILLMVCILIPSTNIYSADKNTKANESDSFPGINVGSRLQFGNYPFETDGTEKPIEWIVLAKDGGKTLLLSRYLLDRVPYNDKSENVSWENCFIRKWLNEEFISKAFNDEENGRIQISNVQNNPNPDYSTPGGNATSDKVFLLSIEECEKYFKNNKDRVAFPTPYAVKKGAASEEDFGGADWQWLRSPGKNPKMAAIVQLDGKIHSHGFIVEQDQAAARPAIWVEISN